MIGVVAAFVSGCASEYGEGDVEGGDGNNSPDNGLSPDTEDAGILSWGCVDNDGGDTYVAGGVSFYANGGWIEANDTCKSNKILYEMDCDAYHGDRTTRGELSRLVMCDCVDNRCVNEVLHPCTDPLPNQPPEGGHVWSWSTGNILLDYCEDDNSVRHITCDEDGKEKQDVTPCPSELACESGLCGGIGCYDTDPENDPMVKGQVESWGSSYSGTYYDSCFQNIDNIGVVMERYCVDGLASYKVIDCPEGTYCNDGRCAEMEVDECEEPSCEDSDPENDLFVEGAVKYFCNGELEGTLYDSCVYEPRQEGGDEAKVSIRQPNCYEEYEEFDVDVCPDGSTCVGGKCVNDDDVTTVCWEDASVNRPVLMMSSSDGTDSIYQHFIDFCLAGNAVRDYYCAGSEGPIAYRTIPCQEGSFCFEGKCNTCEDDDVADDPSKRGTVMDIKGNNQSDYCVDNDIVQVKCGDLGEIDASNKQPCPAGTTCDEGACK